MPKFATDITIHPRSIAQLINMHRKRQNVTMRLVLTYTLLALFVENVSPQALRSRRRREIVKVRTSGINDCRCMMHTHTKHVRTVNTAAIAKDTR